MTTFENRFSSTISDAQGNSYIVNSVVNTNEGSFGVGYMAWNYPYVCNKTFGLVMNFDNEQITFAYKYEASVPYLLFQKVINLPNGNLKVRGSLTHSYDSFALASPYSEPVLQKAVPFTVEMTPQGKIVDAFSLNITDFMGQDIVATPDGGSITIDLYRTSLANGFVPFRTLITMFDNSTVLQQSIRKNQIGSITAGINDQNNLLLNGNVGLGNNAGTEEVSIATGESLSLQYPVCSGDANFNVLAMNVTSNMQQFVGSYQQSQLALIQYDTNHQLKNIFTYTHPSAPIAFLAAQYSR
ncbi:MAG: hypothetical protein HWD59_12900 [Coxiellaceae bacterium]|nr:MAG: hypothetical protein HWD59_12900 [Coxiellaceae bacterium]